MSEPQQKKKMSISMIFRRKRLKPQKPSSQDNVEPAIQLQSKENNGSGDMEIVIQNSTNTAFQEAWRQHWKDLSEIEQAEWSSKDLRSPLQAQKTVDDLNQLHREQSIARKIADRTLTFLKAIETLMAGATIGIQAYPEVSSVVVGVIRVVINAAVRYFEYYEKLTEMMEYLAKLINALDVLDGIDSGEPRLHETLVSIYSSVLSFCRHARRAYIDRRNEKSVNALTVFAKVQWVSFEDEYRRIRLNLEQQVGNLNTISTAIIMKSTSALEEDMKKKQSLESQKERRDFLEWISQDDINIIHDDMASKRYEDTGSWLLETNAFKRWIKHTRNHVLWLYGPAGTGKSVLASMVINHLKIQCNAAKDIVIYAYCKGLDPKSQTSPVQMMSALLKQLCSNLQTLPDAVLKLYRDFRMNARRPSFDNIKDLFLQSTRLFGRIFVVLDGLDECEEKYRKPIMQFVCEISNQSGNTKAFVASRRELDILRTFSRHGVYHVESISPSALDDMKKLIKHRVTTDLSHVDLDIQQDIIKKLIDNSKGMYLWVDLQLNDLIQVPEFDMKTQLKLLPVELEDTYLKMFRKINALPQTTRDLAQVCFLWAFNAKEVLDSGTFVDAVSLAHKNDSQQKTPYNAHVIEEVTFGLLTVSIIVFKRVRPIHFSLQEFVIHPRRSHPPDLQNFLPDAENANAKLAILCIQHLILDVEAQDTFFTCLIYCGKNFDSHILSITTTIPADLWAILDRIFLTEPELMKRLLRWKFPSQSFNYPNHVCIGNPKEISPAMFMRVTSLHKIPAIWNRYKDAGQTPQDYPRDYLFLAALLRMNDIVKDIISQGIYINTATMDRHTALHYAIWDPLEGRDETDFSTMQILLDAGADWNFDARHVPCGHPREDYLSPINLALSHPDHYAAVQPMVKHHSFNFATYMKTIPVDGADKIRVLIERGADINQRDEYGDTALQIAREDGRQDCVEILKDLGALE